MRHFLLAKTRIINQNPIWKIIQRSTYGRNQKYNCFCSLKASQAKRDLPNTENTSSQKPKARWEFWNQLEGGGLSNLYLYCFPLTELTLVFRVHNGHDRLVLQTIWHFYAITSYLKQRSKKVVFLSHSSDWSRCPQNFLPYILKLSRCCDCWSIENRWLRRFVQHCW